MSEEHDQPKPVRRRLRRRRGPPLRRLVFDTADVARIYGRRADAIRRQCERLAVAGPDGQLVAKLDLGIVGYKSSGRWRFIVPPDLLPPAR